MTDGLEGLAAWLRKEAATRMENAASRKEEALTMRRATPEELRASKKLAEQMSRRKLDLVSTTKKSAVDYANLQDRIVVKLESEAAQLQRWADALVASIIAPSAPQ